MRGDRVELDLVPLVVEVELRNRAERCDACVIAEDRDLGLLQLREQRRALVRFGQVAGAHVHLYAGARAQLVSELIENLLAARDQDEVVSAGCELAGERHSDS